MDILRCVDLINLMMKKLLFVLQLKYKGLKCLNHAIFSIIHVKVKAVSPDEIECSCVPVNVLKGDIDEGRSPFGEGIEDCYQVDSKIVYQNNSFVNGKSRPNNFL